MRVAAMKACIADAGYGGAFFVGYHGAAGDADTVLSW